MLKLGTHWIIRSQWRSKVKYDDVIYISSILNSAKYYRNSHGRFSLFFYIYYWQDHKKYFVTFYLNLRILCLETFKCCKCLSKFVIHKHRSCTKLHNNLLYFTCWNMLHCFSVTIWPSKDTKFLVFKSILYINFLGES